jgi:carbon starvation protein CstA
VLAILGVVAAPITSGDTAFRSARLIVADFLDLKQDQIKNRLYITVPLFIIGFLLTQIDFSIIWRYMAWSNQTLATIVLWTITVYLFIEKKFYWVMLIPSIFMTAVVSSYILVAPEGLAMDIPVGRIAGIGISLACLLAFYFWSRRKLAGMLGVKSMIKQ